MTVSNKADDIRRGMDRLRQQMHREITDVRAGTEAATSWHYYVRRYPWAALATAAAVGYLLVPRRRRDGSQRAWNPVAEKSSGPSAPPRKGLLGLAVGFLGPIAVRAAQGYAVNYLDALLSPTGVTPSTSGGAPNQDTAASFGPKADPPRNGGQGPAFPF